MKSTPSNKLKEQVAKKLQPLVEAEFWSQYAGGGSDYMIKKSIKEDSELAATQILNLILDTILASEEMQVEQYTIVGHTYDTLNHAEELIGDGEAEWKDPRNQLRADLRTMLEGLK